MALVANKSDLEPKREVETEVFTRSTPLSLPVPGKVMVLFFP